MSGTKSILLDTNILIYFLEGNPELTNILNNERISISFISEIEILSHPNISFNDIQIIKDMLNNCEIIETSTSIKSTAIYIRRNYKLKLPDAIIAATAISLNLKLITSDKAFQKIDELNLLLHQF